MEVQWPQINFLKIVKKKLNPIGNHLSQLKHIQNVRGFQNSTFNPHSKKKNYLNVYFCCCCAPEYSTNNPREKCFFCIHNAVILKSGIIHCTNTHTHSLSWIKLNSLRFIFFFFRFQNEFHNSLCHTVISSLWRTVSWRIYKGINVPKEIQSTSEHTHTPRKYCSVTRRKNGFCSSTIKNCNISGQTKVTDAAAALQPYPSKSRGRLMMAR